MRETDLSTLQGCGEELQACSRGLAYMDHWWGTLLDALDEAETTWDAVKSDAAADARDDLPKAATAAEINGAITSWVNKRPSAVMAREAFHEKQRQKAKLERWYRSLEKRISAAQSAQNGHQALARLGGGGFDHDPDRPPVELVA